MLANFYQKNVIEKPKLIFSLLVIILLLAFYNSKDFRLDASSETLLLDDNKIKNSSYNSDLGFGFRAISDEIVAYSHSNEISKNSLRQSLENLKSTLKSVKVTYNH